MCCSHVQETQASVRATGAQGTCCSQCRQQHLSSRLQATTELELTAECTARTVHHTVRSITYAAASRCCCAYLRLDGLAVANGKSLKACMLSCASAAARPSSIESSSSPRCTQPAACHEQQRLISGALKLFCGDMRTASCLCTTGQEHHFQEYIIDRQD